MDLNHEPTADSYVYGTAIEELAHVVRVCLEQGVSAYQAIDAVIQCAEMGSVKYPVRWIALDPRIHYFPSFEMALANAMLTVPPAFRVYYAEEGILFSDLICAVSKHISADGVFYVYAVVVGLNEVFSHATVGTAITAARRDREEGEQDLGF